MKIIFTYVFLLHLSLTIYGQQTYIDTIPTKFWGVDENEYYTYISSNTGLYILERDSNNIFGNIYNIQDSLGLLFIHRNYLLSGDDYRLKIFDITSLTNPMLILDTLLNYPIRKFKDFNNYFFLRLGHKFLLADIINDQLVIKYDSDSANPSLSYFRGGSEFYYPYAFLNFDSWPSPDTLITYRYELTQNNFYRLSQNFIFQHYFIAAGAFNDILFTAGYFIDLYGDPNFYQHKYSIDTLTNTFTHISQYNYFAVAPEVINSFTLVCYPNGPRKYNFGAYHLNISADFSYPHNDYLTKDNLYHVHSDGLYYSSRVTADSIIFKLIDFNPTTVNETNDIVRNFQLQQNYPNPFNPATTIKYQIPELSFVTLKIYDVLGNEITTLVNEEKPTGNYEVEFDGTALSSGIYFYRLQAGFFIETKKMVLLR